MRWARPASPTVVHAAGDQPGGGVGASCGEDTLLVDIGEGGRVVGVLAPDQQRGRAGPDFVGLELDDRRW